MKAIALVWNEKKGYWQFVRIPADTVEDVEEFLTHTNLFIKRVTIDGNEIRL